MLCDGIHGTSADSGIITAKVVDERLHRAFLVHGNLTGRGRSRRLVLLQGGIEFEKPGRGVDIPIIEPEHSHEFVIGEGTGQRGRPVIRTNSLRIAGDTVIRALRERPGSLRFIGGEGCTRLVGGVEIVEPTEGIRDLLRSLKDARHIIGQGWLNGHTGRGGSRPVHSGALFSTSPHPVPEERESVWPKEPRKAHDGTYSFDRGD
jgi:hypothetical protein